LRGGEPPATGAAARGAAAPLGINARTGEEAGMFEESGDQLGILGVDLDTASALLEKTKEACGADSNSVKDWVKAGGLLREISNILDGRLPGNVAGHSIAVEAILARIAERDFLEGGAVPYVGVGPEREGDQAPVWSIAAGLTTPKGLYLRLSPWKDGTWLVKVESVHARERASVLQGWAELANKLGLEDREALNEAANLATTEDQAQS